MTNKTKTPVATATEPRKPAIETELYIEEKELTITSAEGEQLTAKLSELPQAIIDQLVLHGLKQKLVDAAAIPRDDATGKSAAPAEKFAAIAALYERLKSGEWNSERTGRGSLALRELGYFVKALLCVSGKSIEFVGDWVVRLSPQQKRSLMANPKIAQIMAELRFADVKEGESEELLANLMT